MSLARTRPRSALVSTKVKPGGTIKLAYSVSEASTLEVFSQSLKPGHKKGSKCVAHRKRKAKKCTLIKVQDQALSLATRRECRPAVSARPAAAATTARRPTITVATRARVIAV